MKNNTIISLAVLLLISSIVKAQDLLDQLYFEDDKKAYNNIEATFKMLRIGFSHSVETRKKGVLEISSYTRYWNLPQAQNTRKQNSFAADRMSARFGFDYALTDNFSVGAGWSNSGVYDGYSKFRLIRQKTGAKKSPVSLTILTSASYRSKNIENIFIGGTSVYDNQVTLTSINLEDTFTDKVSFTGQLLLARKIDRNLSIQLSPTIILRGSNRFKNDPSTHLAIGLGGRYKIGKHLSIASEYFYVPKSFALESIETFGPYSLGINWEVSKVQVQLFLTHTGNFAEDLVITETTNNFNTKDGNLFFGWNFSYVFHLKKKK